jgi:hypothetical protein
MADTTFLARTISRIRLATDEPANDAKYSDSVLTTYIESAFAHVYQEISRVSTHPIVTFVDVDITDDQQYYALPATVGKIIDIKRLNSSDEYLYHLTPSATRNPVWPGIQLMGRTLYLQDDPDESYTIRIWYLPDGCVHLHYGDTESITNNDSSSETTGGVPAYAAEIELDGDTTNGSIDYRPNAYVGCTLRFLHTDTGAPAANHDLTEERLITAYDADSYTVTVKPHFDNDTLYSLSTGESLTYEIAPPFAEQLDLAIALYVSRYIKAIEQDQKGYSLMETEYNRIIRSLRLSESNYQNIIAKAMQPSNVQSPNAIHRRTLNLNRRWSGYE